MQKLLFLIISIIFVLISVGIDRVRGVLSKVALSFLIIVLGFYAVGNLLTNYSWVLPIADKLCIGVMAVAILNIIVSIFRK